jgi:hypothetical protein
MNISEFFQEAIAHSRRETVMKEFLNTLSVDSFANKSFDDIFSYIWRRRPDEVGKLGVYDITSRIFRHHGGTVPVVYLVGNGPKHAVNQLGLQNKIKTRYVKRVGLNYIEINDVLEHAIVREKYTGSRFDGDALETFLCVIHKV